MVVLFHFYTNFPLVFNYQNIDFWGFCSGVDLFFIISGFVIYLSISKATDWKLFLVNRFSRIYPAYWVSLSITAFAIVLSTKKHILGAYLVNLSMFQHFLKVRDLDYAYWTLAVELNFYLLVFILLVVKKRDLIQPILSFIMVLGVSLIFLEHALTAITGTHPSFVNDIFYYFPLLGYSGFFLIGVILFNSYQERKIDLQAWVLLSICVIAQAIMHYQSHLGPHQTWQNHTLEITAYLLVFTAVTSGKIKILNHQVFLFFGKISYPLYLVHQIVGLKLIGVLVGQGINFWLALNFSLVCMIGLAYLINKFIEQPGLSFIRTWYKKNFVKDFLVPSSI